jgi:ankyrin repeat protein
MREYLSTTLEEPIAAGCYRYSVRLFQLYALAFSVAVAGFASNAIATTEAATTSTSTAMLRFALHRVRNMMFVNASINHQISGYMVVDTGSDRSGIDMAIAERLSLHEMGSFSANNIVGSSTDIVVTVDSISADNTDICGPLVVSAGNPMQWNTYGITPFLGVLGMDILGRQPFSIDFDSATLTLFSSSNFAVPSDADELPIRRYGNLPIVKASVEGASGWFVVDTGYPAKLLISHAFVNQHDDLIIDHPRMSMTLEPWSSSNQGYQVHWTNFSFSGAETTDVFGKYVLNDTIEYYAGLIGNTNLLGRTLTVDMAARRMWVKKSMPAPLARYLEHAADAAARDLCGTPPLLYSVLDDRTDATARLLDDGVDPGAHDQYGVTALIEAAARGQKESVILLLNKTAGVDVRSTFDGNSALTEAATFGRLEAAEQLLNARADVNAATLSGRTPLFLAADGGFSDLVQLLVVRGADVDRALPTGETPLLAACHAGDVPSALLLLDHKANPNAAGPQGNCLTYAAFYGSEPIIRALIAHGADVNRATPSGLTPLIAAAMNALSGAPCVKALLDAGANAKLQNSDKQTAFDLAREHGSSASMQLLLNK